MLSRSLLASLLASTANALQLSGAGAYDWHTLSWDGILQLPGLLDDVSIVGAAQVTVGSAVDVASLSLGNATVVGTELLLESTFDCRTMTLHNGKVIMDLAGELRPESVFTIKGNTDQAADAALSGGKLTMGVDASMELEVDAHLTIENVQTAGGQIVTNTNSSLTLVGTNAFTAATVISGQGELLVQGALTAAADLSVACHTQLQAAADLVIETTFTSLTMTWDNIKLWMPDTAEFKPQALIVVVMGGGESDVQGGSIIMEGAGSFDLQTNAQLALRNTTVAGGDFAVAAGAELVMSDDTVSAATSVSGQGRLVLQGALTVAADFAAQCFITVQTGAELAIDTVFTTAGMSWDNAKLTLASTSEFRPQGVVSVLANASGQSELQGGSIIAGSFDLVENAHLALLSTIIAGGDFAVASGASLTMNEDTISAAITVSGQGELVIQGVVTVAADFAAQCHTTVEAAAELLVESIFTTADMQWADAKMALADTAEFRPEGVVSVLTSASGQAELQGGAIVVGSTGSFDLLANARLMLTNTTVAGGDFALAAGATLVMSDDTVSATTTISGEGELIIQGTLAATAGLVIQCHATVEASADLAVETLFTTASMEWENAKLALADNAEFSPQGLISVLASAAGQSEVVGGSIVASGAGSFDLVANAQLLLSNTIVAGGDFALSAGATLVLSEDSISAATTVTGEGDLVVQGALTAAADFTVQSHAVVEALVNLTIEKTLTTVAMEWESAKMMMAPTARFEPQALVNILGQSEFQGGSVVMGANAAVALAADARLALNSVAVAGGDFVVNTGAQLVLQAGSALSGDVSITGEGEAVIQGTVHTAGVINNECVTLLEAGAELVVDGTLNAGVMLWNLTTVTLDATARLNLDGVVTILNCGCAKAATAAPTPPNDDTYQDDTVPEESSCKGGTIGMGVDAKIEIEAFAAMTLDTITLAGDIVANVGAALTLKNEVVVNGATIISGEGAVKVTGSLVATAAMTIEPALALLANANLAVAAGVDVNLNSLVCGDTSSIKLAAAAESLTSLKGANLALAGALVVDLTGFAAEPTEALVLMTATGGITGTFDSVEIIAPWASSTRRLLAEDGSVTYDDKNVYYTPADDSKDPGTTKVSMAPRLSSSLPLLLLASVMHLFAST